MNPETGSGATQDFNNQGTTRAPDTYGSGMTDTNTVNAGPHNSKAANKMDPRVDSDLGKSTKVMRRKPASRHANISYHLLKTTGPRTRPWHARMSAAIPRA